MLAYPVMHAELPPASDELRAALAARPPEFLTPQVMRDLNLNWVGREALFDDVYAFPGNGDLSGLPPTYVLNSEADSLRSSGERFGEQLAAAERAGAGRVRAGDAARAPERARRPGGDPEHRAHGGLAVRGPRVSPPGWQRRDVCPGRDGRTAFPPFA